MKRLLLVSVTLLFTMNAYTMKRENPYNTAGSAPKKARLLAPSNANIINQQSNGAINIRPQGMLTLANQLANTHFDASGKPIFTMTFTRRF